MNMRTDALVRKLLTDLNEPQREAVEHQSGPLLILAGPGSGKTRVVTRRAAMLALTVADPREILAVTFTNKAVQEMRDRIEAFGVAGGMTICTFHSLGVRLLRTYADQAGLVPEFSIFDTEDRRKALRDAIEACDLSTTNWNPAMVESVISMAKSRLQTAAVYTENADYWRDRTIARIYEAYDERMAKMNALDFDDLLLQPCRLLENDGDVLAKLRSRYRFILVDEYQDTNVAQYRLAYLLTGDERNLCATGDPDQSIYAWRGADIGNILRFEEDFPDASVIRLEQNYRSTGNVLAAANVLISANEDRKDKTLWTENDEGPLVEVREFDDARDEAQWLASHLRELQSPRRDQSFGDSLHDDEPEVRAPLGEAAIFYRTNAMSRMLEEALLTSGVPYRVARGVEFYRRREIKDALAYLRVLINPQDELSLIRIINVPTRGIGDKTQQRLLKMAANQERPILELIRDEGVLKELGRAANALRNFGLIMDSLMPALEMPVDDACEHVLSHAGLRAYYQPREDVDQDPAANLDELVNAAAQFRKERPDLDHVSSGLALRTWLEQTALVSDTDGLADGRQTVTLMTMHAAKGLEFDRVFVVGLEDGLIPLRRGDDDEVDMEEERRLLFVGMTRSRRHLTLSRARYRLVRGSAMRTVGSPFLNELPKSQINWTRSSQGPSQVDRRLAKGMPDDIEQWEVGTLVRHPGHGLGRIMHMSRSGGQIYVRVHFRDGPEKSFALAYSDLTRVDYDEVS
ncbi:MAG: ATP-dependent helicase [Phycisphaerae bacterium]